MYALIDWHILNPGDPGFNVDYAKTFFAEMASRHGDKPNVLYEIANEPNGSDVDWATVKSYAEEVIPVIRAEDPDGVVIVGTPGWSSLGLSSGEDPDVIIQNQVEFDNVMYSFHFYAASHGGEYLQALSYASDHLPMFVTEWGTQDASGDAANDFGASGRYLDLLTEKKISWCNWNFSDDHRSGAVLQEGACNARRWTDRLKPAGEWVLDRLTNPPDAF
jgi:endoglucanase